MDLGTSLIGAFIIAICILPFIVMSRNSKKHEKQILQSLIKFAEKENCKISQHHQRTWFAIGIDELKDKVFFIQRIKGQETSQIINLNLYQSCQLSINKHTIKSKSGDVRDIEISEMYFPPIDKGKASILLNFFNIESGIQLHDEDLLVEKWINLINTRIKAKKLL